MTTVIVGTVVAAFGRHYEVETEDGRRFTGFPKGKKSPFACGDRVELDPTTADQGQILRHLPRTSLLYRSDAYRQKLIAANATQLVLVVATEPSFHDELLVRALVAANHEHLPTLIVLNKCDLAHLVAEAEARLKPFADLGLPVLHLVARDHADALAPALHGHRSVLVGQSGMGKSTLINALVPGAQAQTREISVALDSGKHTTTHARSYRLDADSCLIDSPGLQEFGLAHLSRDEIEAAFPGLAPWLGQCRFRNCRHEAEPDCALKQAVDAGHFPARWLDILRRLADSVGMA